MTDHNILAICADTREFVPVKFVDPNNRGNYVCSKCNTKVVFRNCTQKIKHFAHLSVTNCNGESDLHKFGKIQLKRWLDKNYSIYIKKNSKIIAIVEKKNDDKVFVEKGGLGYIADVVIYTNEKPRIILEVTHTHKTTSDRPYEWYDIPAYGIAEPLEIDYDNKTVTIRGYKGLVQTKRELNYEEAERLEWAEFNGNRVKKGLKVKSKGYVCDLPCFDCRRITYYPIFSEKRHCFLNCCAYGCREEECEL